MFTFGFSKETEIAEGESNEELTCLDCNEIKLNEIIKLSQLFTQRPTLYKAGHFEIQYISTANAIQQAIANGSGIVKEAESKHSDLVPGEYEGGFKIWECTRDLIDLLVDYSIDWHNKRVLDLGCGAGLLGLFALMQGAHVVFHDYNKEVIELLTGQNVLLNVPSITDDGVQFYSGDWSAFLNYTKEFKDFKFDYILTSETIYNPSNYGKLSDVIDQLLRPEGKCFLAGKSIYFGVGGSINAFLQHINQKTGLRANVCWSNTDGVAREILEISKDDKSIPTNT